MSLRSEIVRSAGINISSIKFAVTYFLIAIAVVFTVVKSEGNFYSLSVDLSYHHALASTLQQDHQLGTKAQDHLIVNNINPPLDMNTYPPLSHIVAVVISEIINVSLVNGMNYVFVSSIVVVWGVVGLFLIARHEEFSLLTSIIIFSLCSYFGMKAIHGYEIVSNFFYSQVFSDSLFYLAIWILYKYLQPNKVLSRLFLIPLFGFIIAFAHLMPALKLAATFSFLALWEVMDVWLRQRRLEWRGGLPVLVLPLLILHPSFAAMRLLSENDGGLVFEFPGDPLRTVVALAGALGLISGINFIRALREPISKDGARRALAVLSAAGLGFACLAVLQFAANKFLGEGSPYAVKKHIFGLWTFLLLHAAVLLVDLIRSIRTLPLPFMPRLRWIVSAMPAILAASVTAAELKSPVYPVEDIVRGAEFAAFARDEEGGRFRPQLYVNRKQPPVINHMISLGTLRASAALGSLQQVRHGKLPLPTDGIRNIIVNADDATLALPDCALPSPRSAEFVIVDFACVYERNVEAFRAGTKFDMRNGGPGLLFLGQGWYGAETGGVWTAGRGGWLMVPRDALPPGSSIEVEAVGFVIAKQKPTTTVRVHIGGDVVGPFVFTKRRAIETLRIPVPDLRASDDPMVKVLFEVLDPMTPKALGLSNGTRQLGMRIVSIRLAPEAG